MKPLKMETKDGMGTPISDEVSQEEASLKLSTEEIKEMDLLITIRKSSFFFFRVTNCTSQSDILKEL